MHHQHTEDWQKGNVQQLGGTTGHRGIQNDFTE